MWVYIRQFCRWTCPLIKIITNSKRNIYLFPYVLWCSYIYNYLLAFAFSLNYTDMTSDHFNWLSHIKEMPRIYFPHMTCVVVWNISLNYVPCIPVSAWFAVFSILHFLPQRAFHLKSLVAFKFNRNDLTIEVIISLYRIYLSLLWWLGST